MDINFLGLTTNSLLFIIVCLLVFVVFIFFVLIGRVNELILNTNMYWIKEVESNTRGMAFSITQIAEEDVRWKRSCYAKLGSIEEKLEQIEVEVRKI